MKLTLRFLLIVIFALSGKTAYAAQAALCGNEGVWIQILGAGGPELDDGNAGPSYLVWLDGQARLLVDTAPGSATRFDESGAKFADLDAIVFTHLHADHTADFPSYVKGSYFSDRARTLTVLGPDGNDDLANFLTHGADSGYKISTRNVPAQGRRRWSRFGTERLRLAAIPVHHSVVPAVAWRVDIGDQLIVFTGDFNNQKNLISSFAENTDALVVSHAIPETARGAARDLHALPSQLGQIAQQANARMLILGHRMNRTRGRETQSREAIEKHFQGPLIFANDLECWGL
jgi:ribonuclease BN (tRNA processing enzyme)